MFYEIYEICAASLSLLPHMQGQPMVLWGLGQNLILGLHPQLNPLATSTILARLIICVCVEKVSNKPGDSGTYKQVKSRFNRVER